MIKKVTHYERISGKLGVYEGEKGSERRIFGVQMGPGTSYFVDSTNGNNNYDGLSWSYPLADIDTAIGKCTASAQDIIWVAPGHTETITGTDITVDVAGVSVIGIGAGDLQPQIKHNHADAEISIAADDVLWKNIRHSADVTGVKVAIEIEDGVDDVTVEGCLFDVVATTTDEFLVSVRTNDASNRATIADCDFDMGLGGAVAAISFTKDTDGTVVRDCRVQGDYSTACIEGITTASTKVLIENNLLINGGSAALNTEPCIQLLTASTGTIRDNDCVCNLATMIASIVADACMLFRNYYNEDVNPGTGTIMGTASADG